VQTQQQHHKQDYENVNTQNKSAGREDCQKPVIWQKTERKHIFR